MPYFPQINSRGIMVQRPYSTTLEDWTTSEDQPSGPRFGYLRRSNPLGRWDLQYPSITDAETAVLETFFDSMQGKYGVFTFLDPGGNLVQYSDLFSDASWSKYTATVGSAAADPFGGNLAMSVTGTSSNSMLATSVLPSGNASGFVICGSVWVKAPAAQTLSIGFIDSGFSVLGQSTWNLAAGQWQRIYFGMTLASNAPISLLIGGLATWGTQTLALFGAQVSPAPGPGGYQRSPGNNGLHATCRFDQDRFAVDYKNGPNSNAVKLKIFETK